MDPTAARKLLKINYQFYQSFASDFSETRGRLQPGVAEILGRLDPQASILDLGCGNGQVARELEKQRFQGTYLGTDFSPALLEEARRNKLEGIRASFQNLDLTQEDWADSLPDEVFQVIFCFAALHHIPSGEIRLAVVKKIRCCLDDQGTVYISNWQFLHSERYRNRILPWEIAQLRPQDVEEGDYLLDWRRGGMGIRYVHHFTPEELEQLARKGGFRVQDSYFSDGKEGNLGLYQIWEPL